jgi:hypothetical protein
MSVMKQLDALIDRLVAEGWVPTVIVLSYRDHWYLSYQDLGGPGVGYPRPAPYYTFATSYREIPIIHTGLSYHAPPSVGVRREE